MRPHKYLRKYMKDGKPVYVYHESERVHRVISEDAFNLIRTLAEKGHEKSKNLQETLKEVSPEEYEGKGEEPKDEPEPAQKPKQRQKKTPPTLSKPQPATESKQISSSEVRSEVEEEQHNYYDRDGIYTWARQSELGNLGQDLLGSARHRRNAYRDWETLQSSGDLSQLNRNYLQRAFPVEGLIDGIRDKDTVERGLYVHYALAKYPPKPVDITQAEVDRANSIRANNGHSILTLKEAKEHNQRLYFKLYERVKSAGEKAFKEGLDPSEAMIAEVRKNLAPIIEDRSQAFHYLGGYNQFANYANKILIGKVRGFRRAKNSAIQAVYDFLNHTAQREPERVELAKKIVEGSATSEVLGEQYAAKRGRKSSTRTISAAEFHRQMYVDDATRVGPSSSTPDKALKKMVEDFKLRGIQWGNAVTDDERKDHAVKAADALSDLMDVTGLPPEMASFNKRLGLAIGARGRGRALAHYETETRVINLTRNGGMGSLAHEWGHFFDNILAEVHPDLSQFASESVNKRATYLGKDWIEKNPTSVQRQLDEGSTLMGGWIISKQSKELKDPVMKSLDELDTALLKFETRMTEKTVLVDGLPVNRTEGEIRSWSSIPRENYWFSRKEVLARAFETYVHHKLKGKDRKNNYLVGLSKSYGGVYPTEEEIGEIETAFDKLFSSFKSSEYLKKAVRFILDLEKAEQNAEAKYVSSVAVLNGNQLLMGQRRDSGRWTLPGGHFELGEHPRDAAKRELFEEAGIDADSEHLECIGRDRLKTHSGKDYVVYSYLFRTDGETPHTKFDEDKEVSTWKWIDISNGLPSAILNNLHSPKNSVLMNLGLQKSYMKRLWERLQKSKAVSIPKKDLIDEHKHLIYVLESPSRKDDLKEAKKQKKELKEYVKKSFVVDLIKAGRPHKYLRKYMHNGEWIYIYHEGQNKPKRINEDAFNKIKKLSELGHEPSKNLIESLQEHHHEKIKALMELSRIGYKKATEHLQSLGLHDILKKRDTERVKISLPKIKDDIDLELSGSALEKAHESIAIKAIEPISYLRGHPSSPAFRAFEASGFDFNKMMEKVQSKKSIRGMLEELHKELKPLQTAMKDVTPQYSQAKDAGGYANLIYNSAVKGLESAQFLPRGYSDEHKRTGNDGHQFLEVAEFKKKIEEQKKKEEEKLQREAGELRGSMAFHVVSLMTGMNAQQKIEKAKEIDRAFKDIFGKKLKFEDWPYQFDGVNVTILQANVSSGRVSFIFEATDSNGNAITESWHRSFVKTRSGNPQIYNAYLVVKKSSRNGLKIGSLINKAQQKFILDHAPETGEIAVTAGKDVGGYNWANQGFSFESPSQAMAFRNDFKRWCERKNIPVTSEEFEMFKEPCHFSSFDDGKLYEVTINSMGLSPEQLATKSLVGISGKHSLTPAEIQNGRTDRMMCHAGKAFLLGKVWQGIWRAKNASQSVSQKYFENYAQAKNKAIEQADPGFFRVMQLVQRQTSRASSPQEVRPASSSQAPPAPRRRGRPPGSRNRINNPF